MGRKKKANPADVFRKQQKKKEQEKVFTGIVFVCNLSLTFLLNRTKRGDKL